ncbi:MAG TPA: hypothetical protein VGO40_20275 [Longimicrobium sp.]|jgi:hypothetical protein|nr:hypothetical protein [Longimicrobium sp.]
MSKFRNTLRLLAAAGLSLPAVGAAAMAQTTVPLNTGYNHALFAVYAPPTTPDNYWINIASYPATMPPSGPAWVIPTPTAWSAAFPGTRWINARNTAASAPGTSAQNPSYTIFRKCFCLLPNFNSATLSFQVRADNQVQAWFNSVTNVALAPVTGNFNSTPRLSLPSSPSWFHTGTNCIYVLVEDTGVLMGMDLQGTIQANGLMPLPATGVNATFTCPCATGAAGPMARQANEDDGTLAQIVRIAEDRRRARSVAPSNP